MLWKNLESGPSKIESIRLGKAIYIVFQAKHYEAKSTSSVVFFAVYRRSMITKVLTHIWRGLGVDMNIS